MTPKYWPPGSIGGSSVPFTARTWSSTAAVLLLEVTLYTSRTRAPTVPAL